jgi:WD40 repeat protein
VLACDGGWRESESGLRVRGFEEGALVRLHDTRTGKESWSRPWANPGGIGIAQFTPDGRRLLLGSWDGWLSLYEVATGQPAWRLGLCRRDITAAVFSADGRLLVTADNRLGVCSRFFTKKEWLAEARRAGFAVGKEVKGATALRLWPLPVGGRSPVILEWGGPRACSLALSADGRRLACGLSDGTVLVWDVRSVSAASLHRAAERRPWP